MCIRDRLILIGLLTASWTWVHQERQVPEFVHAEIQNNIKQLITDYIQDNLPTAQDLEFHKVWTQPIGNKKLKAFFKYSFNNPSSEQGDTGVLIDGYALLEKSSTNQKPGYNVWTLQDIHILNNHLTFNEGIEISPNDSTEN